MFAREWILALEDDEILTIEDAAKLLRVSPATVWRLVRSGALPAVRVGRKAVRIRRAELASIIAPAARDDDSPERGTPNVPAPDRSSRASAPSVRSRAARRILSRRDEIGPIEESTTELIDAPRRL